MLAAAPVRMKPSWSRATVSSSHSVQDSAQEEEQEREGKPFAARQHDGREVPVVAVEHSDLASVSNGDAVALELVDEVVGHRLSEVGAAVEERDERAAAGEPDGRLAGGVAAANDGDARAGAEPRLGRTGGVEDRESLVLRQALEREPAVLGAGREQDGPRGDLVVVFEADEVAAVPGSSERARYGVAVRALNLRAWVTARPVSSVPLIPAGKPR